MTTSTTVEARVLTGLPLGRRIVITHDNTVWMGYPLPKLRRFENSITRSVAAARYAQHQLSLLVGKHPELWAELAPTLTALDRATTPATWSYDHDNDTNGTDWDDNPNQWRADIRGWAREHGHTRVRICGAGKPNTITVNTAISRIRKATPPGAHLDTTATSDRFEVRHHGTLIATLAPPD